MEKPHNEVCVIIKQTYDNVKTNNSNIFSDEFAILPIQCGGNSDERNFQENLFISLKKSKTLISSINYVEVSDHLFLFLNNNNIFK